MSRCPFEGGFNPTESTPIPQWFFHPENPIIWITTHHTDPPALPRGSLWLLLRRWAYIKAEGLSCSRWFYMVWTCLKGIIMEESWDHGMCIIYIYILQIHDNRIIHQSGWMIIIIPVPVILPFIQRHPAKCAMTHKYSSYVTWVIPRISQCVKISPSTMSPA